MDIKPNLEVFIQKLQNLHDTKLIGGWEETLASGVNQEDETMTLFGTELWEKARRNKQVNSFVTDKRVFSSIRNDTIESLQFFMIGRMCYDNVLLNGINSISAFSKFCATAEDIKNVHRIIAPDVDLALLAEEYTDIQLRGVY